MHSLSNQSTQLPGRYADTDNVNDMPIANLASFSGWRLPSQHHCAVMKCNVVHSAPQKKRLVRITPGTEPAAAGAVQSGLAAGLAGAGASGGRSLPKPLQGFAL
jgi:hypothetical protein